VFLYLGLIIMRGKFFLLALVTALTAPLLVKASVLTGGTRVVYQETRGEAVVQLRQPGDAPVLVQLWLDDGDDSLDPQDMALPFLITPTIVRMDPGGGQSVRVLRTGSGLPQDRESMFFFNILEVPPAHLELIQAGEEHLQFSTRSRIKFFYRPEGLTPRVDKAPGLMRFSLVADAAQQGGVQVRVYNPSPYHITFKDLSLHSGNTDSAALAELDQQALKAHEYTVEPMNERILPLKSSAGLSPSSALQVKYGVIGDLGEIMTGQKGLD